MGSPETPSFALESARRRDGPMVREMMCLSPLALRIDQGVHERRRRRPPRASQQTGGDATLLFYPNRRGAEGPRAYVQKRKPDFQKSRGAGNDGSRETPPAHPDGGLVPVWSDPGGGGDNPHGRWWRFGAAFVTAAGDPDRHQTPTTTATAARPKTIRGGAVAQSSRIASQVAARGEACRDPGVGGVSAIRRDCTGHRGRLATCVRRGRSIAGRMGVKHGRAEAATVLRDG